MNQAEAQSRRGRSGVTADRLANSARLGVLSRLLGVEIKRHRDPGTSGNINASGFKDAEKQDQDETVIISEGF